MVMCTPRMRFRVFAREAMFSGLWHLTLRMRRSRRRAAAPVIHPVPACCRGGVQLNACCALGAGAARASPARRTRPPPPPRPEHAHIITPINTHNTTHTTSPFQALCPQLPSRGHPQGRRHGRRRVLCGRAPRRVSAGVADSRHLRRQEVQQAWVGASSDHQGPPVCNGLLGPRPEGRRPPGAGRRDPCPEPLDQLPVEVRPAQCHLWSPINPQKTCVCTWVVLESLPRLPPPSPPPPSPSASSTLPHFLHTSSPPRSFSVFAYI